MGIIEGAIIGAIVGGVVVVIQSSSKSKKYATIMKSIQQPVDYSGLYHYASFKRYKNSFKFYDSFGVLYLIGKTVYYKVTTKDEPVSFDLNVCSIQQEPDWRMLKWFSITNPSGEKFYFNSNKMGALKNNSEETLKGFETIKARAVNS